MSDHIDLLTRRLDGTVQLVGRLPLDHPHITIRKGGEVVLNDAMPFHEFDGPHSDEDCPFREPEVPEAPPEAPRPDRGEAYDVDAELETDA